LTSISPKQKKSRAKNQHRVSAGILATLFLRWDAIASNLPTSFYQSIKLVTEGSLPPETKKIPTEEISVFESFA
jgi:hypothetical protein